MSTPSVRRRSSVAVPPSASGRKRQTGSKTNQIFGSDQERNRNEGGWRARSAVISLAGLVPPATAKTSPHARLGSLALSPGFPLACLNSC